MNSKCKLFARFSTLLVALNTIVAAAKDALDRNAFTCEKDKKKRREKKNSINRSLVYLHNGAT
jgi:hypothetical protein